MGFNELGTCPFQSLDFIKCRLGEKLSPSFIAVCDKLGGEILANMVYEEGQFERIEDSLAVKVFCQTENLNLHVADTVYRLLQQIYVDTGLQRKKNKILMSDRKLPLDFSGKSYTFREEGYVVEVGLIGNHVGIHFHQY